MGGRREVTFFSWNGNEFLSWYSHSNIKISRTKAFEQDLDYFYGTKWRKENDNEAVQKYIDHLDQLANEEPLLLIAYFYHLYMGLLSGGQILSKKKYLFGSKDDNDPNAVTTFDDSPSALKKKLR